MRVLPNTSVAALPIGTTPTDSVASVPTLANPFSVTRISALTISPGRTFARSSVTVTTVAATVGARSVTLDFFVVSFPARSRATTVIATGPTGGVNDSLNEPSWPGTIVRPFTVTVAPISALPWTTTFGPSTVELSTGPMTSRVGGCRSRITV